MFKENHWDLSPRIFVTYFLADSWSAQWHLANISSHVLYNFLCNNFFIKKASFMPPNEANIVWRAGKIWRGGGHCVLKWILRRHFKPPLIATIEIVWSYFYRVLAVLKHHRRLWANVFDTDICSKVIEIVSR